MSNQPRNLKEAEVYRYAEGMGYEGDRYQPGSCAYECARIGKWNNFQCRRPNGHGPENLYCKVHARKVEKP